MKLKKLVSGMLVFAMAFTCAFSGGAAAKAETLPDPVKSYDFNNGLGEGVSPVVKGLGEYSGTTNVKEAGRSGGESDFSVKLDGYGLKLEPENLGENYTVSMWVKPDNTIATNTPIVFLGYHSPEKWVAISGESNSNSCKVWTNDGTEFEWATVGTVDVPSTEWSMLTLSQEGDTLSIYQNGLLVKWGKAVHALNGEKQGIWLGVNNWDPAFKGLIDDVAIYNTNLSARQVHLLYDDCASDLDILNKHGKASENISVFTGKTGKIDVTYPSMVNDVKISYESKDASIASVDAAGVVTGVKEGQTEVIVSLSIGNEAPVTKTTAVTVKELSQIDESLVVNYDSFTTAGGKILDISGHGNDASVRGNNVAFANNEMIISGGDSYIELPVGIMDSLTDQESFTIETTFEKSASCGKHAWLFCLGAKVKGTGTNYLFLSPNFDNKTLRSGIKNNNTEKLFGTNVEPKVGQSYTVDMVFDHGKIKLYWDGVLIQGDQGEYSLDSGFSIMDDVVNPGKEGNVLGYIGKSCWAPDGTYNGKVSSFKIYNKALTDAEVQLSRPEYLQALEKKLEDGLNVDDLLGSNYSESNIKYNLSLPSELDGTKLEWVSEPAVISNTGVVTNGTADTAVTLTAKLVSGALEAKKEFALTVKPLDSTSLQALLSSAEETFQNAADSTQESRDRLKKAIDNAKMAIQNSCQTEVDSAEKALQRAMDGLEYPKYWSDPFEAIDASNAETEITIAPGEAKEALILSEAVKDMVTVSYDSSNPEIAKADDAGNIIGVKAGYSRVTATVTAKSDGFSMEYQKLVKVDFDITKVTVQAKKSSISKDETTTLKIVYPPEMGNMKKTISYQADGAVSVKKDGTVKGEKKGTGTVTVMIKAGGKVISIPEEITVTDEIAVKAKAPAIAKGSSTTILIKYPADVKAKKPTVTYKASGAVSVDKKGKVTGRKAGTGTVALTIKAGKSTFKKTVTIQVGEISGQSSVLVRKSITLKVSGLSGKAIWSVDQSKLASINSKGVLKAKRRGRVKVTAKVGSVKMTKIIAIR